MHLDALDAPDTFYPHPVTKLSLGNN